MLRRRLRRSLLRLVVGRLGFARDRVVLLAETLFEVDAHVAVVAATR